MAIKPKAGGKPSARAALVAAQKAARKAEAEVARLSAEVEDEGDEDQDGVEAVDGDEDDEDQDGVEAIEVGDNEDEDEDSQTEAQKIAGSAEAAANPKAANAAIASGMTFAQFKGQVRAQGGQGGGRRLAGVLGGSPRLGADAKGGGGRDKGLDPSAIYKRRANRARPQST